MSEVTRILSAIEQGDPSAAEQVLPLVFFARRMPRFLALGDEGSRDLTGDQP